MTNTTAATDLTIANEILRQLGGHKFCAMTGAKDFVGGADYLEFRLPRGFARLGINRVKITLNAADLYNVEFFKMARLNLHKVADTENVHCEDLRAHFTTYTGLDTRL